jgi:hypothetical protein
MFIRRRGSEQWCLEYPAFEETDDGKFRFIFDYLYFRLKNGRYEARIRAGNSCCGSIELDLTTGCKIDQASVTAVEPNDPHIILEGPEGMSNIYDGVINFKAYLCRVMEPGDTTLPLRPEDAAKLCNASLCKPVQLVVFDPVKSETVEITGCVDGVPMVERCKAGTMARKFPVGSCVQFSWTSENVVNVMAGCDP